MPRHARRERERERERERRIALDRDVQRSQRRVQLGQRRELGLAELLVHAALSHSIVELADEHMVGLRRAAPCSQCATISISSSTIIGIALLLLQQLAFLASASLSLPLAHILLLLLLLMLVLVLMFEAKLLSRPLHRERAINQSRTAKQRKTSEYWIDGYGSESIGTQSSPAVGWRV